MIFSQNDYHKTTLLLKYLFLKKFKIFLRRLKMKNNISNRKCFGAFKICNSNKNDLVNYLLLTINLPLKLKSHSFQIVKDHNNFFQVLILNMNTEKRNL